MSAIVYLAWLVCNQDSTLGVRTEVLGKLKAWIGGAATHAEPVVHEQPKR